MAFVYWIVLGLVVGFLAKFLMPGNDPGGFIITVLLGIGGAILGGYIGTKLGWGDVNGFDLRSLALATGGGVLLLLAYRALQSKRV